MIDQKGKKSPRWIAKVVILLVVLIGLGTFLWSWHKKRVAESWEFIHLFSPISLNEAGNSYLAFKSFSSNKISPKREFSLVQFENGLEVESIPTPGCWGESLLDGTLLLSCSGKGVKIIEEEELVENFQKGDLSTILDFSKDAFPKPPALAKEEGFFFKYPLIKGEEGWGGVINGQLVYLKKGSRETWKASLGKGYRIEAVASDPCPLALLTTTDEGKIFLWKQSGEPQWIADVPDWGRSRIHASFNKEAGHFVWAHFRDPAYRTPRSLWVLSLDGDLTELPVPEEYASKYYLDRRITGPVKAIFDPVVIEENPLDNEVIISMGKTGVLLSGGGMTYTGIWRARLTETEIHLTEKLETQGWIYNVGYFGNGNIYWIETPPEGMAMKTSHKEMPTP